MIVSATRLPVLILLVAVLGFNLTQRKHLSHGEDKRFASLRIAGLVLLLYAAILVIEEFDLSELLLLAVLFVIGVFLRVYREHIFLFRFRCPECGRRYPLIQVLYYDTPACQTCTSSSVSIGVETDRGTPAIPQQVSESDRSVNEVSDVHWETHDFTDRAVLCYIRVDGRILLIEKKTGLGAGKVNAPGGRIEDGETPEEAAIREVGEEIIVTPENLKLGAEVSFVFTNGYSLTAQVFLAESFTGEPTETVEAKPFWVDEHEIPYDRMWEDDREWLPTMLEGTFVKGRFIFDGEDMISSDLTVDK